MEDKPRFHTAAWDLSVDLEAGLAAIVVIDARCRDAYIALHIPGAVSFPHLKMNSERRRASTAARFMSFIAMGSAVTPQQRALAKRARLGFRTKELLGGLDWWRRDGHPVAAPDESGCLLAAAK